MSFNNNQISQSSLISSNDNNIIDEREPIRKQVNNTKNKDSFTTPPPQTPQSQTQLKVVKGNIIIEDGSNNIKIPPLHGFPSNDNNINNNSPSMLNNNKNDIIDLDEIDLRLRKVLSTAKTRTRAGDTRHKDNIEEYKSMDIINDNNELRKAKFTIDTLLCEKEELIGTIRTLNNNDNNNKLLYTTPPPSSSLSQNTYNDNILNIKDNSHTSRTCSSSYNRSLYINKETPALTDDVVVDNDDVVGYIHNNGIMYTSRKSNIMVAIEKDNEDLFNENIILRKNLDQALKACANLEEELGYAKLEMAKLNKERDDAEADNEYYEWVLYTSRDSYKPPSSTITNNGNITSRRRKGNILYNKYKHKR